MEITYEVLIKRGAHPEERNRIEGPFRNGKEHCGFLIRGREWSEDVGANGLAYDEFEDGVGESSGTKANRIPIGDMALEMEVGQTLCKRKVRKISR